MPNASLTYGQPTVTLPGVGAICIYCRISKDREGRAEGVETQERRGREYAAQHWPGLPVVVYSDNDLTAADPEVERPGFDALVAAVRRGEVAQVVCAEQSRLTRIPAVWDQLAVTLAKAGITHVHTYRKGVVDVGGSKLVGRILAAVDAEEVEVLKARTRDKLRSLASQGRPTGGLPYPYRPTVLAGSKHLEVVPERAEVVRQSAERLLSGWSMSAIVRDLNERGVPTRQGLEWKVSNLRSVLTSPGVAGLRRHDGQLIPATWAPVLDIDTWRAVHHVLSRPITMVSVAGTPYQLARSRRPRRSYLLSGGIARCAVCGAPMKGAMRSPSGRRSYACSGYQGGKWCVSILADPLEEYVADRLFAEMDRPGFWDAFAADPSERSGLLAKREAVAERQALLAEMFARGELEPGEWQAARKTLQEERSHLDARLAALPPVVVPVSGARLKLDWDYMTLGEQRRAVELGIASVSVARARPGTRTFDPNRVIVNFR